MGLQAAGGPRQRCRLLLEPKDGSVVSVDLGERRGSGHTWSWAGQQVALQGSVLLPQPLGSGENFFKLL